MATMSELRVGQSVTFGRERGEKTKGVIIKINPRKVKVQTTEDRGAKSPKGAVWSVPPSLINIVEGANFANDLPTPREKALNEILNMMHRYGVTLEDIDKGLGG